MEPEASPSNSTGATGVCVIIMIAIWLVAPRFVSPLPPVLVTLVLLVALSTLCWFDFDHYRIPDWISLPLIVAGLTHAAVLESAPFIWHLAGAIAGYGLIWGLNAVWTRIRGREGIGMGDAKLLAGAGAWLGLAALPIVTLIASVLALIWILGQRAFDTTDEGPAIVFPFGPFLSIGFFSVWIYAASLPYTY